MKKTNSKVQLSRDEILNRYFITSNPIWYDMYAQISADQSISEVDATQVVNLNGYSINMFLGANCSNSNELDFEKIKYLFLSGKRYSKENLEKLNIGLDFNKVSEIDLSNNDFGKYNFVWDFGNFLFEIDRNICSYIYPVFAYDLTEARKEAEDEFDIYGFCSGDTMEYVIKKMDEVIKPIMAKLIPNVKNTNIKILINLRNLGSNSLYELIEDILKRGNFDGCYIKVENCNHEFIEKLGLSENNFELYQYQQNISLKRKK